MNTQIYLEGNSGTGWQFAGACKTVDEAQAALALRQKDYPQCEWRIVYPTESARTEHTPGPWRADGDIVVSASHDSMKDPIGGSIADCSSEANARLIAAAPALLEALEGLLQDKYLSDPINADRMTQARQAIAMVKGEK